jgi:hypothetical protein
MWEDQGRFTMGLLDQNKTQSDKSSKMDGPAHVAARGQPPPEHLHQFSPNCVALTKV